MMPRVLSSFYYMDMQDVAKLSTLTDLPDIVFVLSRDESKR